MSLILVSRRFAGTASVLVCCWQVVGAVGLELWVESSGPDADVFAYLEDIDLKGSIRYTFPYSMDRAQALLYVSETHLNRGGLLFAHLSYEDAF